MDLFQALHHRFERLASWAVWAGGAALLLSAFMVTVDVLFRKFAGMTMSGSDEITGYVFAGATTWAYSYCLLHRSHIRIDAIYNMFPIGVRAVLDIIGLFALLFFMGFFTLKAKDVFLKSWELDSVSVTTLLTPLWIPQIFWLAGLIFFVITLAFMFVYCLLSLFVAGPEKVQSLAGAMSVSDEMKEETKGISEMEQ